MDEVIKWMIRNYPTLLIVIGSIIVFLYILKEIKDVFFSIDSKGDTFGTKLFYFFFFWVKRKTRVTEPEHVKYSDDEREKVVSKLLVHNFFQSIHLIKRQIPFMEFGLPKKSQVLREVIEIYVDTVEKYSSDVLKNYKLDELKTSKLNDILLSEIDKASYEIYSKMKIKLGDVLYIKLIEDPTRGFRSRNAIFREVFVNGVTLISSQSMSVYNYDNYERASEILTSMYVSMNVIVKNFEKVFKEYNGELDKYFL